LGQGEGRVKKRCPLRLMLSLKLESLAWGNPEDWMRLEMARGWPML
jgi:hypothetical protein